MTDYLGRIMFLSFLVDLLLLLGGRSLCSGRSKLRRLLVAAALGGVYAGLCLLPGLAAFGAWYCHLLSLLLIMVVAYGVDAEAVRNGWVFLLLYFSLHGLCGILEKDDWKALLAVGCLVTALYYMRLRQKQGKTSFVPVTVSYRGKTVRLTAMEDTGNQLRDPVTGGSVLVVNATVARQLLGLTQAQLADPVKTVGSGLLPGLRLIPIQTVNDPGGMLLAKRFDEVEVGSRRMSKLVAFSPLDMDQNGVFQALIGGTV